MIITSHFNSLPLICVKFYFSALAAIGNFCCLSKFNCLESFGSCTTGVDSKALFPLEKGNSTEISQSDQTLHCPHVV